MLILDILRMKAHYGQVIVKRKFTELLISPTEDF